MANQKFSARNIWACLRALADAYCLIAVNPGVPTSGTSGTLVGFAGTGCLLIDTTNGKLYINTGNRASPTWTVVGAQV